MLNDNYLAHYGILGMKWGIRRYQNSNGSLTDAGKKRYNDPRVGKSNRAIDAGRIETSINRKSRKAQTPNREAAIKQLNKYRNELVSNLDKKTIQYGRDLETLRKNINIGGWVGGYPGMAIATVAPSSSRSAIKGVIDYTREHSRR